jgi:alkylation response protein AidB-like acyl-CoA dehydrogenase
MTESNETVEAFRARARSWITANLPSFHDEPADSRALQNLLFDNGFAGIAFPTEYGGAGLTLEHQKAFYDEADLQERQTGTQFDYGVSIGMLGPTILDHGSEDAKRRFLPPLLRGDERWMQLLSEPSGGSDMAGSLVRLTRDGDVYLLNGAKMWSSGAHEADYGLCLCRSDWDAPKHRGLSMIAVPLKDNPKITIQQTRSASGLLGEYCQEFFDDVPLPPENMIGTENSGWSVAQSLLFHERNTVGNIGYGYFGRKRQGRVRRGFPLEAPLPLAVTAAERGTYPAVEALVVETYIDSVVDPLTSARMMTGMRVGTHRGQWGSLSKLQSTVAAQKSVRTSLAALGAAAVMWDGDEPQTDNLGTVWLESRGGTISGGSNEMQRNIISERLLGLPREPAPDRDLPFSEVLRNLRKS